MTPENQRIAIAEFRGYKRVAHEYHGFYSYFNASGECVGRYYWPEMPEGANGIPELTLDELHEAEKLLKGDQIQCYENQMRSVWTKNDKDEDWSPQGTSSSAWWCLRKELRAEAEALLRTIGKWEEP